MDKTGCSSLQMAHKLEQLNSLITVVHRTLDSSDSSIFLREAINLMEAAKEIVGDCEMYRQKLDAELYQKASKYYKNESLTN